MQRKPPSRILGQVLKQYRMPSPTISLRTQAQRYGITHTTLQRIEAGAMPTVPTLIAIARWHGWGLEDCARMLGVK